MTIVYILPAGNGVADSPPQSSSPVLKKKIDVIINKYFNPEAK